jgi:hypothetical protein
MNIRRFCRDQNSAKGTDLLISAEEMKSLTHIDRRRRKMLQLSGSNAPFAWRPKLHISFLNLFMKNYRRFFHGYPYGIR